MLQRVPLSSVEGAIQTIEADGGVILSGFTSPAAVNLVNSDMEPYMQEKDLNSPQPGRTNCSLLFGRSETARENWICDKSLQAIINHFLRTTDTQWGIQRTTDPLMSMAFTIRTDPGTEGTGYHRDDHIWQPTHTSQETTGYRQGSDLGINIMVPGVDVTVENGATKIIPGSHLWGDDCEGTDEQAVSVEMKKGEAFVFLASAVHAGTPNASASPRIMHTFFFCRGWLRQEDNQYVWWTKKEVSKWSKDAQKLAGYIGNSDVGCCNFRQPIDSMRFSETIANPQMVG